MEEDKNIFGTVIFDILAMSITLLMSTVNYLYYIFMVASIILLFPIYKDTKKYKNSDQYVAKKFYVLISLACVSLASLGLIISLSAIRNSMFTYIVYGLQGTVFLICFIYTMREYIQNRKAKKEQVKPKEEEKKLDFTVEEMGTSIDREQKNKEVSNNSAESDTIEEKKDENNEN